MSTVIVAGDDPHGLGDAIEAEGHEVVRVDIANRPALEEAGILDVETYVLTEMQQATSISVAKDLNPDLKVLIYSDGSLPDYASRQTDLSLDPELFETAAVAAELDS